MEMLEEEEFPGNTLFCGDAGFVGYPLWNAIATAGQDFLIRVGANVNLLSKKSDIKQCGGGMVLCWPKGKMNLGSPPLHLRLIQVKVGKTKMWMLTSVLDPKKLTKRKIIRYYEMRWGIEVEFRGLKQTIDKHKLRCRNSDRLFVELDWSIRAMAIAELIALREQIPDKSKWLQTPASPRPMIPRTVVWPIPCEHSASACATSTNAPNLGMESSISLAERWFSVIKTARTNEPAIVPRTQIKNR